MALRPQFLPNQPIPNNPFYSPETSYTCGPYYPVTYGAGLTLNYQTSTLNVTGGGGTGSVTLVSTGTGLTGGPITTTGTIALTNTAVVPGSYTNATLTVDQQGRLTAVSSGTGVGSVTSVGTGTGLTGGPITSTGTIALADTAISPGSYSYATFTVDQQGRLTSASSGTAPVTCINTGTALTGGPITSTGTIALADTTVVPGTYDYARIVVDQQGRITSANSGTAPSTSVLSPITNTGTAIQPTIGIQTTSCTQLGAVQVGTNIDVSGAGIISVKSSSTTQSGIVQLNDTVTSTSILEALTANQGKNLQDQINALSVASNLTLAGTFDASTSKMLTVTSSGTAAGFTVGSNIPAAAAGNNNYFVIVTTPGTYSPPGGGGPYTASQGDWFASNGATWQFLNVGVDLPLATTGTLGIVQLATSAETQTGTDTTKAVTSAGLQSKLSDAVNVTSSTTIASSTAVKCAYDTAVLAVPCAAYTAKGSILAATGAGTPVALPVGTNGQVLIADSTCTSGVKWGPGSGPATPFVEGTVFACTTLDTISGIVALGQCAAACSTTAASGLTAVGVSSAYKVTSGNANTALGYYSLYNTTIGYENTAVGYAALIKNVDGNCNVSLGSTSGNSLLTGSYNVFLGARSGANQTGGNCNVLIGPSVQAPNLTGNCQLVIGFGIGCNWLIGNNTGAIQPSAGLMDCTSSCGTAGQVLVSTGSNAIQWCTLGLPLKATTTADGLLLGCTTTYASGTSVTSLGNFAGGNINAPGTVAIGTNAMCAVTTGYQNTSVGFNSLCSLTTGYCNVGLGAASLAFLSQGTVNVAVGSNAGLNLANGDLNTFLGSFAGSNQTGGNRNVAIGPAVNLSNLTGDCQLAIGFNNNSYWITGNSTKAIKPGAGIIDCANSCGTVGQALVSTGSNAVVWCTIPSAVQAQPALLGTVYACTTDNVGTNTLSSFLGYTAGGGGGTGLRNVGIGAGSLGSLTNGASNTAVGSYSGQVITTGYNNALVGCGAGLLLTSGFCNTFIGTSSGSGSGTGVCNVAVGAGSGSGITTGSCNVAIGPGVSVASGTSNCQLAIGWGANYWLTGDSTKAIRPGAGIVDCAGSCGTLGQALVSTGSNGLFWCTIPTVTGATPILAGTVFGCTTNNACFTASLGYEANCRLTTGVKNTAVGVSSLFYNSTGIGNTAVGACSLYYNTGSCNTTLGSETLIGNNGCGNVAVGYRAGLNAGGSNNLYLGSLAVQSATNGDRNVIIGPGVAQPNASGSCQLAIGFSSTDNWLTGCSTKAIRPAAGIIDCAGSCGTVGQALVSTGANALIWCTIPSAIPATPTAVGTTYAYTTGPGGNISTFLGYTSGNTTSTGQRNTGVGIASLSNVSSGGCNTALGVYASTALTTGSNNVTVGESAGLSITSGGNNVLVGTKAGASVTAGSANTLVGDCAGFRVAGLCNTFLGFQAGCDVTTGCANVAIGQAVQVANPTANCQLAIGFGTNYWLTGDSTKAIKPGAGIIDCAGSCGTAGQVLASTGANNVVWCSVAGQATPTVLGTVLGCTLAAGLCTVAYGRGALASLTTGDSNVGIGYNAGVTLTNGIRNIAIGSSALGGTFSGSENIVLGHATLSGTMNTYGNVIIGSSTMAGWAGGSCNVAIGKGTGIGSYGDFNVVIGAGVSVPTGNVQMAIGINTSCWISGDSSFAIKPGAGIRDCAGSVGTANQALLSTGGNAVCWGTPQVTCGSGFVALGTAVAIGPNLCARINSGTCHPEITAVSGTITGGATTVGPGITNGVNVSANMSIPAGSWCDLAPGMTSPAVQATGISAVSYFLDTTNSRMWEIVFTKTSTGQIIRALPLY